MGASTNPEEAVMNPFLAEMYVSQRLALAQEQTRWRSDRPARRRPGRARRFKMMAWRPRRTPVASVVG